MIKCLCNDGFNEECPIHGNKGTKYDQGKPALALIPAEAIFEIGKVFTFGARKYGAYNWRKGLSWTRLLSATLRHIYAFLLGEDNDPESGYNHLAHAGACICMLLTLYKNKTLDDRYVEKKKKKKKK